MESVFQNNQSSSGNVTERRVTFRNISCLLDDRSDIPYLALVSITYASTPCHNQLSKYAFKRMHHWCTNTDVGLLCMSQLTYEDNSCGLRMTSNEENSVKLQKCPSEDNIPTSGVFRLQLLTYFTTASKTTY
jgi:hypothetical protein